MQVNPCRRSNDIGLVDPLQWDTVDLVWTGDQQETTGELLEEYNTLPLESSSEENDDLSWLETTPKPGRMVRLAVFLGSLDVFGRVVSRSLFSWNQS